MSIFLVMDDSSAEVQSENVETEPPVPVGVSHGEKTVLETAENIEVGKLKVEQTASRNASAATSEAADEKNETAAEENEAAAATNAMASGMVYNPT